MSSIFGVSYRKNIARLDHFSQSSGADAASADRDFALLIADLEKSRNLSGLAVPTTSESAKSSLPESPNITFAAYHSPTRNGSDQLPTLQPVTPEIETPRVNLQPLPVNPPSPQLAVPQAPTLLKATREATATSLTVKAPPVGIREIITAVGKSQGIDPNLGLAVANAESSFRPRAVSNDGHSTKGLFQLLDSTGQEMAKRLGLSRKYDPFDPHFNSTLGLAYLRRLHDLFSEEKTLARGVTTSPASSADDLEKLAVAAFNAGEGNVARAQARAKADGKNPGSYEVLERYLPPKTRQYVARVMQYRTHFSTLGENSVIV